MSTKLNLIPALSLIVIFQTGCVAVMQNAVVENAPPFEQVESEWGPIPSGHGRVVVFVPKLDFNAWNGGMRTENVKFDGRKVDWISDNSFFYDDLPVGSYEMTYGHGRLTMPKLIKFPVDNGEFTYIRIDAGDGKVVSMNQAIPILEKSHHIFKKTKPLSEGDNKRAI